MRSEKRQPETKKKLTKCFSDESSSIPTGLHVSKLEGMQENKNDQCERQPRALRYTLNTEIIITLTLTHVEWLF